MKRRNLWLLSGVIFLFLAVPLVALAQGAQPPDPNALLNQLLTAVQSHNWTVVVGLVLSGVTLALRAWGGSMIPWLKTDRGGAAMVLAVSVLGALGATLAASAGHISAMTLVDAAGMAVSAAGGYAIVKKIFFPADAPGKASAAPPKGFASLRLLLAVAALSLAACTTLTALSGSTGPIPVSSGKDAAGATITTSTVTVTAQPVTGTPPACAKPVSVSFDTVAGYHNQCSVDVPVPPVGGVCQRFEPACFCW